LAKDILTLIKFTFCALITSVILLGDDFTITIESSNDLNEWNSIHTVSVTSDAQNTFYRSVIAPVNPQPLNLETSVLTVTQTWSQETNYARTAHVQVPDTNAQSHPVIIFFHGASGNGINMLNQFSNHFTNYVKIGLDGYDNKWNIKTESSEANDIDFLSSIISQLKSYANVDANNISLIGTSNGAALVLKALLELPENSFKNGIFMAGQLTSDQYRENKFWYNEFPSRVYTNEVLLPARNKIISFHGTSDSTIPYNGGYVNWLNRTFYNAQESNYFLAKGRGFNGSAISGNGVDTFNPYIKEYSYVDYGVYHYKVINGNHGLTGFKNDIVSIILDLIE